MAALHTFLVQLLDKIVDVTSWCRFSPTKTKMPAKQKSCLYDYEGFAPELRSHPCIWNVKHENYMLNDYRALVFGRIECNMGIKSEFSFSVSMASLHIDSKAEATM